MGILKPSSKPNVANFLDMVIKSIDCKDAVYMVGIRGYYLNTMGKKGQNDRGIYDDAIGIISPDGVVTFNANVDPGSFKKGIANLKTNKNPGWLYKQGIHGLSKPKSQQYMAFVQADKVTVSRDKQGDDTGYFGINIHKGRTLSVSSLGCQTIVPSQWDSFYSLATSLMKRNGQKTIRYFLMDVI